MTTDLKWIAALLAGEDVAPHQNFRTSEVLSFEAGLALHLLGRGSDAAEFVQSSEYSELRAADSDGAALFEGAVNATTSGRVVQGFEELRGVVRTSEDEVIVTAAALVAAVAAADQDRLRDAVGVLRQGLDRVGRDRHAPLLRALLLQGLALRLWDLGESGVEESAAALTEIERFKVDDAAPFTLNRAERRTWDETVADMVTLVADAARLQMVNASPDIDGRLARVKSGSPAITDRLDKRVGEAAITLQERALLSVLEDTAGTISWHAESGDESVVHALYVCEFAGHPFVRHYRKVAAETRTTLALRNGGNPWLFREALRLFRQAGDVKGLKALAGRLDTFGPLEVVQVESEQALGWTQPSQLDESLLHLLQVGAAMLRPRQASDAFDRLSAVRDEPLPHRGFGWQARGSRFERIWHTLFALARTGDRIDDALSLFIADLENASGDELDLYSARVLPGRTALSEESRALLDHWAGGAEAEAFPMTRGAIADRTHPAVVAVLPPQPTLEDVRQCLNAAMVNETSPSAADVTQMERLLRRSMQEKHDQARTGTHTFGGPIAASLAVAAMRFGADLAEPLADVLLDPAVPREQKADAMDRLAGHPADVPPRLVELLKGRGAELLRSDGIWGTPSINPFPEGLRLLGTLRLVPDDDIQVLLSQLLGSSNRTARDEGVHTIRRWVAVGRDDAWLESLVIYLSHSAEPELRGVAGNTLCQLAARRGGLHGPAELRIEQMLHEDGSLIPRQILNGVKELAAMAGPTLVARVEAMAAQHPHREVRALAVDVARTLAHQT